MELARQGFLHWSTPHSMRFLTSSDAVVDYLDHAGECQAAEWPDALDKIIMDAIMQQSEIDQASEVSTTFMQHKRTVEEEIEDDSKRLRKTGDAEAAPPHAQEEAPPDGEENDEETGNNVSPRGDTPQPVAKGPGGDAP